MNMALCVNYKLTKNKINSIIGIFPEKSVEYFLQFSFGMT